MTDNFDIALKLKEYVPYNLQEENDKSLILGLLESFKEKLFFRESETFHFTASSWIVDESFKKGLFVYHNIFDSWSWTGGHADGNMNLLEVSLKEAMEETGLENVHPVSDDIFSLEVIAVAGHEKRGKYIPSHLHLNVTFLLVASEKENIRKKEDENSDVKWMPLEEIYEKSSEKWMVERIYMKLNSKLEEIADAQKK